MSKLAALVVAVVVLCALTVAADAKQCHSQDECKKSGEYCSKPTTTSSNAVCSSCSACPVELRDFSSHVVGGYCPTWCTCKSHSECGDKEYCMKSAKGYSVCESCSSGCMDGAAIGGACPSKCQPLYGCLNHTACGKDRFCSASHKCSACSVDCVDSPVTSSTAFPWPFDNVGPIDSACPAECGNLYQPEESVSSTNTIRISTDYIMYYVPNVTEPTAADYTFKSGISSKTAKDISMTSTCTSSIVTLMQRRVFKVVCTDLKTAAQSCDDNQMGFRTVAYKNGQEVASYAKSFDNTFGCALKKALLGAVAIILIVLGVLCGLCIFGGIGFCFCCGAAARARRQARAEHISMNQPMYNNDQPPYGQPQQGYVNAKPVY
eukprot:PhM_4_TR566/c0_g1_i3/m.97163